MTIHQNIHPSYAGSKARKWEKIAASFYDSKSGSCVVLTLEDHAGEGASICIHYTEAEHAQEFVDKLKTAILSLPEIVKEEKKNPAGFVVPPWGGKCA